MSKTILITRPNYDITTNYFHQWSEEVIKLAVERKNKVLDLEGRKANRKTFESYAKKHQPDFFFFNGHGSDTVLIEAHQRSLKEMKKNLRKLLSSENPLSDSTGAVLLWSNIRGQTLLGNPNAVI